MNEIIHSIQDFVVSNNIFISIFICSFLVIMESILPFLPLAVFIAISIIAFNPFYGFLISYISTIIGCIISFLLVRYVRKYNYSKIINKLVNRFEKMSFIQIVLVTSIPFTPAFSINIATGLSNMPLKKYVFILIISKLSIVYFWGFIGTSLLVSITNIYIIFKIIIILLISFILSKIVLKYFNIE